MSLTKIFLLFPSILLFNASFTPPNPVPDKFERVNGPFYERMWPTISALMYRVSAILPCIAEVAVLLAACYPSQLSSNVLSRLVLSGHQLPSSRVDRYLIAGCVLTITGGLGRVWCFRTLGRHFTYELALRKDHTLVTTGPYAIVRHPSYLVAVLSAVGIMLVTTGPGSFMQRCGWAGTMLQVGWHLVLALRMTPVVMCLLWYARCGNEDAFLRERFREEWDKYSQRVKYWMIPGVI